MSEQEAMALADLIDREMGDPQEFAWRTFLVDYGNGTYTVGHCGREFSSTAEWRAWYEWTPEWADLG